MKSDKKKQPADASEKAWHSFKVEEVLKEFNSSTEGLKSDEAKRRLEEYGENKLPENEKISLLRIIVRQLINPLIFILIAAALASIIIGEESDAIFIFLVILINSGLGAYQEYNAEKSASGLQELLKISAKVMRDGEVREIDSELIVPGDIINLESGIKVPADMRLIEEANLEIDESFLTGESVASVKQETLLDEETGVADRVNMAFAGSTVMSGRAKGVVTGTGLYTQVGLIAQNVSKGISAKPPLIQRMERFIKQITVFIIAISVILAIMLRIQGMDFATIFFFVVALAVAAIPEGLPVALTVALSIATKRMAKRNVIVRKLTAVESLGSCTVIASDKTGTLTVNEQTARRITLPDGTDYSITGQGYNGEGQVDDDDNTETPFELKTDSNLESLIKIALLANEAQLKKVDNNWEHQGDAMDVALLGLGYKVGVDPKQLRDETSSLDVIPYESQRKFSGVFYEVNENIMVGVKGAVETILGFCETMIHGEIGRAHV